MHHAALSLFDAMMPEAPNAPSCTALGWAADLHEVGLSIAHNAYHGTRLRAGKRRHAGLLARDQQLLALGRRS